MSSPPPAKRSKPNLLAGLMAGRQSVSKSRANPRGGAAPARALLDEKLCTSTAVDCAITEFLQRTRAAAVAACSAGEIEIEVRLGQFRMRDGQRARVSVPGGAGTIVLKSEWLEHNAEFRAGVADEAQFQRLRNECTRQWTQKKSMDWRTVPSRETVRTFEGGRRRLVRTEAASSPSKAGAAAGAEGAAGAAAGGATAAASPSKVGSCVSQHKRLLGQLNLLLPQCPFDARIGVACEESAPATWDSGANFDGTRSKSRVSLETERMAWRLDLTEVSATSALDGGQERSFEVELELRQPPTRLWLDAPDDRAAEAAARQLVAGPSGLFNLLPFLGVGGQSMMDMHVEVPVGAGAVQEHARRTVKDSPTQHFTGFPGTMPVAFTRRHIEAVQDEANQYYAAEKTDGVRYLLAVHSGTATLVNRKLIAFTTIGLPWWGRVLPQGTVIDGEFVKHRGTNRYVFLAFDVIAVGEHRVADLRLRERLGKLQNLLGKAQAQMDQGVFPPRGQGATYLPIHMKHWHPVRDLGNIFRCVGAGARAGEARVFKDQPPSNKRHHHTDGVVLSPNGKYVFGPHQQYLKWKWGDLVTIDFRIRLKGGGAALSVDGVFASGEGMEEHDLRKMVRMDNTAELMRAVAATGRLECVAEFAFVPDSGLWHYKCLRPDKKDGNYIDVVMDALVQLAEGISEQELRYRLTRTKKDDRWGEQFERAKDDILKRAGGRM
eukprot:g1171.t1